MTWQEEKIADTEMRGMQFVYLGSVPKSAKYLGVPIHTGEEWDFIEAIGYAVSRKGMMIRQHVGRDRSYIFSMPSGDKPFDYRTDLSKLVFGELDTVEGCVVKNGGRILGPAHSGEHPLHALTGLHPERIPSEGQYSPCKNCKHARCINARSVAKRKCYVCKKRIGYGKIFFYFKKVSGKPVGDSWVHDDCIEGDYMEMLRATHPYEKKEKVA